MENSDNILVRVSDTLKKVKAFGIIVSILMIILGGIACFAPFLGEAIVIWMMIIGLFIYGIGEIIIYCSTPKGIRDGFLLASGIIWVVLCVLFFVSVVASDSISNFIALTTLNYFLAIMISFSCIFNAINSFCIASKAEAFGFNKGGIIASGILELLAGLVILSFPIGAIIAIEIFIAIFLIVGGITLLCRCLSYKID